MPNQIQEANGSFGPSLQERQSRREWILGRIATLLGHYWREDDPSELNEAMGRDWADILEGLPQDAISRACMAYLRNEPRRKPSPGAIYALAREMMPRPTVVPKPRSNGWAVKRPYRSVSVSRSNSSRLGRWKPFHNISFTLSPTGRQTGLQTCV